MNDFRANISEAKAVKHAKNSSVISLSSFIQATRNSGYKSISSALAELIDNALEARARHIDIAFHPPSRNGEHDLMITVSDDGCGMSPAVLQVALQFGGSTRFDSRLSFGRYGMGLPNSSLSYARRVEVYSWITTGKVWSAYLDVDEIVSGATSEIPQPKFARTLPEHGVSSPEHGTVVVWTKCDRVDYDQIAATLEHLTVHLGRLFREHLWRGIRITLNGKAVKPIDLLFLRKGNNLIGGRQYGPCLKYEIAVPNSATQRTAKVFVRFVELPIEKWHDLSNEEKRRCRISKSAGVSILRSGREIDYGWFFMGSKRKENYDDWWRCEISFEPELDELFGVTHTKQGINPTEQLNAVLTPEIERVAYDLNRRVRKHFSMVRDRKNQTLATRIAERCDPLLEPPRTAAEHSKFSDVGRPIRGRVTQGLRYRLEHKPERNCSFYSTKLAGREIRIILNAEHPFYERIYAPLRQADGCEAKAFRRILELLLFAAARAESHLTRGSTGKTVKKYRELWSDTLATFLA